MVVRALVMGTLLPVLAAMGSLVLRQQLGAPALSTVIPEAIAAFAAAALGCWGMATVEGSSKRWGWSAFALAGASALLLGILLDSPGACSSSRTHSWAQGLSVAAAALWAVAWGVERRRGVRWPGFTAAMVALGLTASSLSVGEAAYESARGSDGYVRAWNVYHYYLGSKYFADGGYDGLYAVTLAADDRAAASGVPAAERLALVRRTRDMHTYETVSRANAVASAPEVSPETLDALHVDLQGLLPHKSAKGWKDVLSDMGYNPAPAWTVVGQPLARLLSTDGWQLWVLVHLDVVGFVVAVAALWWAWGPRVAAMACLYVAAVGFNRQRLLGGFLQYDWLTSMVVGVALYRKGFHGAGGVALSYAAMTRVFPGFFVFPALVALAMQRLRGPAVHRPTLRFATAFTLACAVWFALSHTTGRGLHTWPEWGAAIRTHSTLHGSIGRARLGLGRLGAHVPTDADVWHGVPRSNDFAVAAERDRRARPWKILGLVVVLGVALRRSDQDRMIWMLALVWVAVVTSRYYGSSWALLLVAGLPARGDAGRHQSVAGVILAVGVLLLPWLFYATDDAANLDEVYFKVNYWMGGTLLLAGLAWLAEDLGLLQARAEGAPAELE